MEKVKLAILWGRNPSASFKKRLKIHKMAVPICSIMELEWNGWTLPFSLVVNVFSGGEFSVNAAKLKNAIDLFSEASGLVINTSKSSILFSKQTNSITEIGDILGISNIVNYIIYLGIPISPKALKYSHFHPLLSRLSSLLEGWKVKFLSFAGRIQFLKFSMDSKLPMFWIPWCNGKTLAELLNRESLGSQDISVYLSNEGWELPTYVPSDIAEIIYSVPILETEIFAWEGSSNFQFKSFMTHFHAGLREFPWHNFVWFKNNALRLSAYTWMAMLGKLKTADVLLSRAIPAPESHKHLFFECDYNFNVLTELLPELGAFLLRPNIFQAFELLDNTLFSDKKFGFLTITAAIYYLWMERNSRRFSNSWNSPEHIFNLISKALKLKTRKWKQLNEISRRLEHLVDVSVGYSLSPSRCLLSAGLGSLFDRPLQTDNTTSNGLRPSIAHVLVELDVTKRFFFFCWYDSHVDWLILMKLVHWAAIRWPLVRSFGSCFGAAIVAIIVFLDVRGYANEKKLAFSFRRLGLPPRFA
ncbi:hypothetical protein M5K25_006276 [Dendrobium thyrsiflorum]|uniref:Reverse transcriptase zinc-binding domain-containing protein n=1 Tax=Dendrobium thyrsiflorum TaxID=117978 RepID=A0ABD0VIE3_DENTH